MLPSCDCPWHPGYSILKQVHCRFWRLLGVLFQVIRQYLPDCESQALLGGLWLAPATPGAESCTPCIMQGIQQKFPRKRGALDNKCSVQNSNHSKKELPVLIRNVIRLTIESDRNR